MENVEKGGSRKKILYLIGSKDPGGAEKVLFGLAQNFHLKGYDVTVGHLGNPWLSQELKEHGIRDVCFRFGNQYSSHKTEWMFVLNLAKFIRAHAFDLIHAHLFGMILYSSIACRILRTPVLGTIHDKYYFMEKEHRRLAYKIIQLLGCKLVAVSEDIRDGLSGRWGIKRDEIVTVYNGIDLAAFDMRIDRDRKRRELGLTEEDVVVISVGRLVKMKGHSMMMSAGRNVVRRESKIKFVIVGDGPERKELERMSVTLGLSKNVIFTGHREDVLELLLMADIFVQTSYTEGLSCTIIEALGAGCPAVVTDVGGNREIISNEREGYLFPITSPKTLEEKILVLAHNNQLRLELARNARLAAKKFSFESMTGNYEELYLNLFDGHRQEICESDGAHG